MQLAKLASEPVHIENAGHKEDHLLRVVANETTSKQPNAQFNVHLTADADVNVHWQCQHEFTNWCLPEMNPTSPLG